MTKHLFSLSPSRIILLSFFFLIILGTAFLSLPISRHVPIPVIDLLFTATSATCVTGLFTIPLNHFTFFGKLIIMLLIQFGALGLASMSLLVISFFIDLGIGAKFMAGQLFELDSWRTIKKIVYFTFISTITMELIGAICFFSIFCKDYSYTDALFFALFHSIASFCNAGISFLHFLTQQNLEKYSTNYLFLLGTTFLTFFGGLGFITWQELLLFFKSHLVKKKPHRFSLHTKIILSTTTLLILITSILFFALEYNNTLAQLSLPLALANTIFHAISFKSCGFILAPLIQFHIATIFLMMIIGFIGSSPESTGSGIKTTTAAILATTLRTAVNGQIAVKIFEREIPLDQIYKAFAIVSLSTCWIITIIFCLLLTEQNWSFVELLLETISAFSNVGFSLRGSQNLSTIGKILISATMLIGRIGSLTFILGLKFKAKTETACFSYPEERVILG